VHHSLDLNCFLPDKLVISDLKRILKEEVGELPVELGKARVVIPIDAKLEVISKIYRQDKYKVGFRNYYRVQVAIGGIVKQNAGILYPKYCFVTLFYTDKKELITLDFHAQMRWIHKTILRGWAMPTL